MFSNIFNFSRQRTALQAFGWYIAFLFFGLILDGILGGVAGMGAATAAEGFKRGVVMGARASVLYVAGVAVWVIWRRQKSILNVSLAIIGPVAALFLGVLGGLIPLAILTTRPANWTDQPHSN